MFYIFIPDIYSLWGQRPFPLILLPELPVDFCPYYVTTFSLRCNSYLSGSHYRFHSLHTFSAPCSALMSAAFARSMNLRAYFYSFPLSIPILSIFQRLLQISSSLHLHWIDLNIFSQYLYCLYQIIQWLIFYILYSSLTFRTHVVTIR